MANKRKFSKTIIGVSIFRIKEQKEAVYSELLRRSKGGDYTVYLTVHWKLLRFW